jgi:hypothetical protein
LKLSLNLAVSEEVVQLMVSPSLGLLEILVGLLRQDLPDNTLTNALVLLRRIAKAEESRIILAEIGGLQVLERLVTMHDGLLRDAAFEMMCIVSATEGNAALVVSSNSGAGVASLLIEALRHGAQGKAELAVLAAVHNISKLHEGSQALLQLGVLPVLVSIAQRLENSPSIVALECLLNLAEDSSSVTTTFTSEGGLLPLLLDIICKDRKSFLIYATNLLMKLAPFVRSKSLVEPLIGILRSEPQQSVLEATMLALYSISSQHADVKTSFTDLGLLPLLLKVVNKQEGKLRSLALTLVRM